MSSSSSQKSRYINLSFAQQVFLGCKARLYVSQNISPRSRLFRSVALCLGQGPITSRVVILPIRPRLVQKSASSLTCQSEQLGVGRLLPSILRRRRDVEACSSVLRLTGNFMSMPPFISYPQNFEDVILWRALKDMQKGVYLHVQPKDPPTEPPPPPLP